MTIFATQLLENSNVDGTKTDVKWLVESLEEKNEEFRVARGNAKVTKVDAFDISGGKGFISKVYKITIHFDDELKESFPCILKIPGLESINEALDLQNIEMDAKDGTMDYTMVEKFHRREVKFYDTFTEIPDLKTVKCYGTREWIIGEQEGALIMDYLGSSSNIEFIYGLNIHQARNILKEIHNLQAYFFSLPCKDWQSELGVVLDVAEFDKMDIMLANNWKKVRKFVPTELYNEYEQDIVSLIGNFGLVARFTFHDIANIEGNKHTFIHGDLWSNNVMFKVDSNGNPGNEVGAIIDWQIVYVGSIAADIARAIIIGCPVEVRREIELLDLPLYYDNLKKEVIKRGGRFEMTWEMFKLNYDLLAIDQSMHLLMMLGFALQNHKVPEEAGDYLWDARKYALGSRIMFALVDAVKKCRLLKPEWLVKKVEE